MPKKITTLNAAATTPVSGYGDTAIYQHLAGPVVATASLPAAATDMDGRIVIEFAGAGDVNLVLYYNGQRFRIDGGSPV